MAGAKREVGGVTSPGFVRCSEGLGGAPNDVGQRFLLAQTTCRDNGSPVWNGGDIFVRVWVAAEGRHFGTVRDTSEREQLDCREMWIFLEGNDLVSKKGPA